MGAAFSGDSGKEGGEKTGIVSLMSVKFWSGKTVYETVGVPGAKVFVDRVHCLIGRLGKNPALDVVLVVDKKHA